MGHHLDQILPIAAAVVATATGNPELAPFASAAASGGTNYAHTHNIGSALKSGALSGAGSYVGGNIGNSLFPATSGSVGDVLEGSLGADIGSAAGRALGGGIMQTGLGQLGGSALGGQLAGSFAPQGQPKMAGNYPFVPSQNAAASMPSSLNSLSSLTPQQQSSSLATQGLYGGGLGSQEQSYYGNLLNRQLVDGSGHVSPLSSLSPIEQSYNSKLGFGGAANSNLLLEALSKWNPSSQSA